MTIVEGRPFSVDRSEFISESECYPTFNLGH